MYFIYLLQDKCMDAWTLMLLSAAPQYLKHDLSVYSHQPKSYRLAE